jgi:hypothetical protein
MAEKWRQKNESGRSEQIGGRTTHEKAALARTRSKT